MVDDDDNAKESGLLSLSSATEKTEIAAPFVVAAAAAAAVPRSPTDAAEAQQSVVPSPSAAPDRMLRQSLALSREGEEVCHDGGDNDPGDRLGPTAEDSANVAAEASEAAALFTDDELLEVLRHLDDENDDIENDKDVIDGIGASEDEQEEDENENGQRLLLPDLDWFMESDDPNDPLAFLVDNDEDDDDPANSNNNKALLMMLDWEDSSVPDGGEAMQQESAQIIDHQHDDDDDALMMRDWTHSSTPTGSENAYPSDPNSPHTLLRPDMFWDNDNGNDNDDSRVVARDSNRDDDDGGVGGVLELLDQLGDLKLLDEAGEGWNHAADATRSAAPTTTTSTNAAGPGMLGAKTSGEFSEGATESNDDAPLPDYLYCQPCTPRHVQEQQALALDASTYLQSNAASDDAGHITGDPWEQHAEDDDGFEDDFASRLNLRDHDEDEEEPPSRRIRKVRPEARRAVQFLLETFDATISNDDENNEPIGAASSEAESTEAAEAAALVAQSTPKPWKSQRAAPKRERIGIGHKERILGMDASECGRFVATAGQDGTAKVWDASKHHVLATIVHNPDHPNDHECLRVAFAPVSWGFHRLPAGLAMLPTAAEIAAQQQQQHAGVSRHQDSRYLLATGGADGRVCVWSCLNPMSTPSSWKMQCELDHAQLNRYFAPESESDTPQIYSLQFVPHWRGLPTAPNETQNSFLLTSSDDFVHLWEIVPPWENDAMNTDATGRIVELVEDESNDGLLGSVEDLKLREVMSIRFGDMREAGWGVRVCSVTEDGLVFEPDGSGGSSDDDDDDEAGGAPTTKGGCAHTADEQKWKFGGDRNPHSLVYVFDGRYCASNGLLAVALSDGTLRLVNGRGVCVTLLHLPGLNSHLTSFAFDSVGARLATTVATGHVILWNLAFGNDKEQKVDDSEDAGTDAKGIVSDDVLATCQAVLSGHDVGRPVFGAAYCGTNEDIVLSWGVDGRICAWDSRTEGEADGPVSVLLHKPEYPVYAVSLRSDGVAVAGGGSDDSFVGIPVYFYDFAPTKPEGGEGLDAEPASDVTIVNVND